MRLLRWVLVFLAGSGLALALVVILRVSIADGLAPVIARAFGIPLDTITISEIGSDRVVVRDVTLGNDRVLRIGLAMLEFDALEGRLTLVSVDDVTLRLDPFGDGPLLGSLQPLIEGGKDPGDETPLPAFPPIRFDAVKIEAMTPLGPILVRLDGNARLRPRGLDIQSALRVAGAGGAATGSIAVTGPSAQTLTARLTLERARASGADYQVEGVSGEASLTLAAGRPPRLRARFGAREVGGGGVSPGGARLAIDATQEAVALDIALGDAAKGLAVAAELHLEGLASKPRGRLTATATLGATHPLISARAERTGVSGVATLAIRGEGDGAPLKTIPATLAAAVDWLASVRFRGTADLGLADAGFRDRVVGAGLDLPLTIDVAEDGVTLGLARDATMTAGRLTPLGAVVPKQLVAALARFAADARITIPAAGDRPPRVRLERRRVTASFGARLAGRNAAAITASGSFGLDLNEALQPTAWRAAPWSVVVENLPMAGGVLSRLELSGDADGAGDSVSGKATAEATMARLALGGADCRALGATLAIEAKATQEAIEVTLAAPGSVRAGQCRLKGGLRTDRAASVRILSARLRQARKAGGPIEYRAALSTGPLGLRSQAGPVRRLSARIRSVHADGRIDGVGHHRGRVALGGVRIAAVEREVAIEDGSISLLLGEPKAELAARFQIGAVRHLASPALFNPLTIRGSATQRQGRVVADATVKGAGGLLDARIRASHRMSDGFGEARITVAPLVFGPNGGAPKDFSPALDDLKDVVGEIRLGSTVRWTAGALDGEATVALEELSFRRGGLDVVGLSGEIAFADLQPPVTDGVQVLSARRIEAGVPFDDARIELELPRASPGKLRIANASARFADGRFTLDDTLLDPGASRHDLTLEVARLDLAVLSALADVEGIQATGRLGGEIPLSIAGGTFSIAKGKLAATGGGRLAIKSASAKAALQGGGQPVALILQAVEDFRYQVLGLEIDKPAAGDSRIRLTLGGNNPAVLDGHPFAFNINLTGDMDKVFLLLRRGTDLSSEILRRQRQPSRP